jgi:hypothetical protein
MIPNSMDNFLDKELEKYKDISFEDLESWFESKMEKLVNDGKIFYRNDEYLGGKALEIKVRHILKQIGFKIMFEKNIDSDGIIHHNDGFHLKKPIVLEIKSGKSNCPSRTQLRQLDDYIFELSGEEKARKEGLGETGLKYDPLQSIYGNNLKKQKKLYHPTPHKGLMIYNNTEGSFFKENFVFELGYNEKEFSVKRDICILSYKEFLELSKPIIENEMPLEYLWDLIHKTVGTITN